MSGHIHLLKRLSFLSDKRRFSLFIPFLLMRASSCLLFSLLFHGLNHGFVQYFVIGYIIQAGSYFIIKVFADRSNTVFVCMVYPIFLILI